MGNFANALKALRNQHGYTQAELAEKLGMTQSRIGMYESGAREPDAETMQIFADFFGVDMNYLYGMESKEKELTMDDFSYALFGEARELTAENKEKLLEMARFFKTQQDKEQNQ